MLTSRRISPAYRKPHTCRQHRAALHWRHDPHDRTTVGSVGPGARRRRARRDHRGALGVPVAGAARRRRRRVAPWRGRRCRPRRHDGLRRRRSRLSPTSIPRCSRALRRAATDAAADGVEFFVDSGWRSPAYQEQLLREAIAKYGSEAEAARWVATPEHVRARVGRRGRHRARRRHGVAVRARRRVRAVPDLRQRTLALRAAPGSRRSRLPCHVRRPTHDPRMQR